MKLSFAVAVLAIFGLTAEAAKLQQHSATLSEVSDESLFANFVSKFQRSYRTKSEYNKRLGNYKRNKKVVEEENSKGEGYELELNKFADLSENEFKSMLGLVVPENDDNNDNSFLKSDVEEEELAEQTVPASVDWVASGAVQTIRNQGSCGSCYTFSALSAIESALYINKKVTVNLSEQQAVDCSASYGNQGCNGGWMNYVFNYAKKTKLATEAAYPYTAKKGTCKSVTGSYGVTGYKDVTANNPAAIKAAVAKGPVSTAISASASVFQLYKSGVLNSSACGTTMNHAVVIVGYGTSGSTPYWLIRNSWGTSWGEKGYIRVYRDDKTGKGICGILQKPSYPLV